MRENNSLQNKQLEETFSLTFLVTVFLISSIVSLSHPTVEPRIGHLFTVALFQAACKRYLRIKKSHCFCYVDFVSTLTQTAVNDDT